MNLNAFVLRMYIGEDTLEEGINNNEIIIGWSRAKGLLDKNLDWQGFREILHKTYADPEDTYRASGGWAGSMWRFIREMDIGDLVVVPSGNMFYVAKIAGEANYIEGYVNEDTAHRRKVEWLNNKQAIPRKYARAALQSRMKARQTCVGANDLVDEIKEALNIAVNDKKPEFASDLRQMLVEKTREQLYSGRLDSYAFEKLAESLINSLGGQQTEVIPRNKDKGADLLSNFYVAKTFKLKLAVQAKHYKPEPAVSKNDIEQLLEGMKAEDAQIGWLITTGNFSDEAIDYHLEMKEQGFNIELIDGEQLSTLIVEEGLSATGFIDEIDDYDKSQ